MKSPSSFRWLPGLLLPVVLLANTAVEPVVRARNEPWLKRHEGFVDIAQKQTGCQVLFLGDSITDAWRKPEKGLVVWNEHFAPLNALNFGISGDRTQHLLWRLQNSEIGGLRPKAVVMMIGTNNVGFESNKVTKRNEAAETAAGIAAIVHYLRRELPQTKILLLAVFPRGEKDSAARAEVAAINALIASLGNDRDVFYLDIGPKFLAADGTLSPEIMPDLLHPNTRGYAIWAEAIREPLARLLQP